MSKKILYISGVISFAVIIFICWPKTSSRSPNVIFHYSATIDHYICTTEEKNKIMPSWYKELNITKPLLENRWNEIGPKLLNETTKIVGKPFTYTQLDIPIFLCPNLPGMGFPIIIPVRMYLKNAVDNPWDNTEFVDMVYHEILHVYIAKGLHWNYWTPLLRKYSSEHWNTKIHLHLFALQKAVYYHLGMEKQWHTIITRCKEFPPQYSRAIEIVENEGYQPFIEELRK